MQPRNDAIESKILLKKENLNLKSSYFPDANIDFVPHFLPQLGVGHATYVTLPMRHRVVRTNAHNHADQVLVASRFSTNMTSQMKMGC